MTAILLAACLAAETPLVQSAQGGKTLLLHPQVQALSTDLLGPFVHLPDGVLAADAGQVLLSRNDGKSWTRHPLFREPGKYQCRPERALLYTQSGAILLAFLNQKEMAFQWDQAKGGPQPGGRLPVYVTRSLDGGQTWEEPILVQDGYCGAIRQMIELRSGRIVLASQKAVADPGRHVTVVHVSDDEGRTWKASNIIDLGAEGGFGDHGGGLEGTLVELKDGRLWMLLRTPRGRFWQAYSADGGLTWSDIGPSSIEASGSPGMLRRLQSGRIALFWNRYIDPLKQTGRREQLSMAFSEDEGKTWSPPVVVAHDPLQPGHQESQHRLSYPYVYEHVPGQLWVTTMQGPLRVRLEENDFLPWRLSDKTYAARLLPDAQITIDGTADEPAWQKAAVLRDFAFPWKSSPTPATEFRAVATRESLYFTFRVQDEDIVVLENLENELDAVLEDRAEIYLVRDDRMSDYYCFEVDSRGRTFDYQMAFYRRQNPDWNLDGLQTAASPLADGYAVEGRIPWSEMQKLGFPPLAAGTKIRWGLFRAEFSHDRSGTTAPTRASIHNLGRTAGGPPPIQEWISWVDPKTTAPDFHVPMSLGFLEIIP